MVRLGDISLFFTMFVAAAVVIPAGKDFRCTPVRVWDGDGPVWCDEGPRVRLAGIAARELSGECRRGHPCPSASGEKARDYLVGLLGRRVGWSKEGHALVTGPTMKCLSTGGAGGKRTGAWCYSPKSGDISCKMVQSGFALRWDKYWERHSCR